MIIKDNVKTIASVNRIWHESHVPVALLHGCSAELEIVHELTHKSVLREMVIGIVRAGCPAHNCLSNDYHEVSERQLRAVSRVDVSKVELLDTVKQTEVVSIFKVQTPIGTSSDSGRGTEVHKVMANQPDQAAGILGSRVVVVLDGGRECIELLDDRVSNCLVVRKSQLLGLIWSTCGTYEVVLGIMDVVVAHNWFLLG